MKQLVFYYYFFSYSIGLPTLVVASIAYLKTRNRILKYYLLLLIATTIQLVFTTVLRYQDITISHPNTYSNVAVKYLYLLSESSVILFLPLFCHNLSKTSFPRFRNLLFGFLLIFSWGIIFSPFFLKYLPQQHQLIALTGFEIYRGIFFGSVLYSMTLILLHFRKLTAQLLRFLAVSTLIFTLVSLVEILHCELFPILKYIPIPIPLSPFCYLVLNSIFIIVVIKDILLKPIIPIIHTPKNLSQYQLTNREKEIIALLIQGIQNREIGQQLFITESTVKTHIQNIYKKLGVQNRVQLVNFFKEE
ncbi:MAG: helix-turn-helix domain-containing protein [Bacteroidota bacterium]